MRAWMGAVLLAAAPTVLAQAQAPSYTPEDYKNAAAKCMRSRAYECVQKNWEYFLRLRPTDSNAMANLGIVMNLRENHAGAIAQFERAIELGEGTYDLFAYYADSLEKVGRIDDAIDWSYRALAVVPRLVDVRGKLAKLLVARKRHYEALSVLGAYDREFAPAGQPGYFEGQRIAVETSLSRQAAAAASPEAPSLRLPRSGSHHYAPITLGEARPEAFVVDTGASVLTMDEALLERSKVVYRVSGQASMKIADGRKVNGRAIVIESVRVGPYEIKNVQAFSCKGCQPLLGQSALSRFDMKSSRVQGVEFLALSLRR